MNSIIWVFVGTIFSGLIILLVYLYKQTLKYRTQLQEKDLYARKQEEDLLRKNHAITTLTLKTFSLNELISKMNHKLQSLRGEILQGNIKVYNDLQDEFEKNSLSSNWLEFQNHIQEIDPDFYLNLRTRFPKLSHNEFKLCTLIRLHKSTQDIAEIMHHSSHNIKVARHRLKKKMGLNPTESLESFIRSI